MRVLVDCLPSRIRNSYLLFFVARIIFQLPKSLWAFRSDYDLNKFQDLNQFYTDQNLAFHRSSNHTDINSFHLAFLKKLVSDLSPGDVIDIGCGLHAHALSVISNQQKHCKAYGVDICISRSVETDKFQLIQSDLCAYLTTLSDNSIDFSYCAHVLEHLRNPEKVLAEIRRVSRLGFVIICPIEKKFKWGMNYHVNFFPDIRYFRDFCKRGSAKTSEIKVYPALGDCLYYELFDKQRL